MATLQSIRVELSQCGKEFLLLGHKPRSRAIVSETGSEKRYAHTYRIRRAEQWTSMSTRNWGRLAVSLHLIRYLQPQNAPIQAKSKYKDRFIGGSSPPSSPATQVEVSEVTIEGETERKEMRKRKHRDRQTDRQ